MNEKNIEEFLRENRPAPKDNPAFLLETQRKMQAVEGIKAEVDRQRSHGRTVLICTLFSGILAGGFAVAIAWLYPADAGSIGEGLRESVRVFLDTWKAYLMFPVAGCAIALGLVLGTGRKGGAARL